GSGATGGTSSTGTTGTTGGTTGPVGPFLGSIAIVRLIDASMPDAGGTTALRGQFLMAGDWPACDLDTLLFDNGKVSCCFQPSGPAPTFASAGVLSVLTPLGNGGVFRQTAQPLPSAGYDAQLASEG